MPSSLAPSQLELAKRWLQTCSKNHNACKGCENNRMPTRLLALGEGGLRLVTTTGWDTAYRPQYATLSHCWGGIDFLKLTTTTLELFKKSIPLEQLTKTFRDTIAVVRKLGILYLWIDSFCIIQDSSEDWETEATLMSSVYGSSTITIAAAGAVNGNSGLFLQPEGYVGKVHIDVPTDSGAQSWDIVAPSIHETSVSKSALSKRAWAVQERLLSPRILYFTDKELFWECGSLLACESFPERLPAECCRSRYFLKKGQSFSGTWSIVVQLYTQANLTFGSDKLVAISGIARIAQKENNDNYLAGMWRNEMEAQLCWHLEGSGTRPAPTEPCRAPSWSWASIDGEIPYQYWRESGLQHDLYLAHVLDAWIIPLRPESTDVFGQLSGGTIVISCSFILSGKLMRKPNRPGYRRSLEVISATPFPIPVELDFKDEDDSQTFYLLPLVANVEDCKSKHSQSENDRSEGDQSEGGQRKENDRILGVGTPNGGNVVAEESGDGVRLNRKSVKNDELNSLDDKLKAIEEGRMSWRRVEGLVLRPSGSKRGGFSRKGWFSAQGREFAKCLSTHGAATAESCCAQVIVQPKHVGERYLITIS